jgi:RimJ/RimL family protein N-acetyltransferase
MVFIWPLWKKSHRDQQAYKTLDNTKGKYLFTSSRLGFRTWAHRDIQQMTLLNSDKKVMEFFPFLPSEKETVEFIHRMQNQFLENGFCYFPVDLLETDTFIGFIGLSMQQFDSDFTPCVDIGWRIHKKYWGQGLATEGALECLAYAKNDLQLNRIHSMAPKTNLKSIKVMEKIGMTYVKDFEHPKLKENPRLNKCVLFAINL